MPGVNSLRQHAAKRPAGSLKMFLVLLVLENTFHAARALLSVDVPQSCYTVKLGSEVAMECHFPVRTELNIEELMITWLHTAPSQSGKQEVYVLHKGEEDLSSQNKDFIGRASLLKEKLYHGAAVLQINNTKVSDNGTYICLIGYRGADYKYIDLKVAAPYAIIEAYIKPAAEGGELVLTCSAEGFPMAEVYWQEDGANISMQLNTSYALTADGLYNVTSTLRVAKNAKNNYHCLFWNKELQNITSKELFPSAHHNAAVAESPLPLPTIVISVCAVLLIISITIMCGVIILKRRRFRPKNGKVERLQMNGKQTLQDLVIHEQLLDRSSPISLSQSRTSTKHAKVSKWHRIPSPVPQEVCGLPRKQGTQSEPGS